jgi:alpha-tubulin suppressor-like RCC1 family protein
MRTLRSLIIATSALALLLAGVAAAPAAPSSDDTTLVAAVSAGGEASCTLTSTGGVKCWGGNRDGAIGDGTTVERPTPTPVLGLGGGVVDLAVGVNHSCVATTVGAARCWLTMTEVRSEMAHTRTSDRCR